MESPESPTEQQSEQVRRLKEESERLRARNAVLEADITRRTASVAEAGTLAMRRLELLYISDRVLATSSTMIEAIPRFLAVLGEREGWEVGNLWLLDPLTKVLRLEGSWQAKPGEFAEFTALSQQMIFPPGHGTVGQVWASGKPAWYADIVKEVDVARRDAFTKAGLHGGFCFPIWSLDKVLGVVEYFTRAVRPVDTNQLELVTGISDQLGMFIERKQSELALRRSNTLLKVQQEATLDGILVVDEARSVISLNRRLGEMWHFPPELLDSHDEKLLLARMTEQVKDPQAFVEKIEGLYARPLETSRDEIYLRDGRVLDRYTAPAISPQGEYFGRVWYFRDITRLKQMENELLAQNEQLKELDRLKNIFVNAVTHELRTPLTSIRGYLEFLEDGLGGPLTDKEREFVEQIRRSEERIERLVADLLDFARIEAGTFKLNYEEAELGARITEIAESFKPQALDKHVALSVSLPDKPMPVHMDPQRVGQVLINLISNAIKFTSEGGTITIRACADDGFWRVEVSDTGEGIAAQDIPKLFHRFAQLEAGLKKGGTGLGLHISKALVEAHGGHIGVGSAPGQGSTFWFTLPRTLEGETEAAGTARLGS